MAETLRDRLLAWEAEYSTEWGSESEGAALLRTAASALPDEPSGKRELLCMKCGKEHPVWYAENPVWNAVVRHADGSEEWPFLCPTCFSVLAAAHGYNGRWALLHEPRQKGPRPMQNYNPNLMSGLR
jgi:hypothetical protein